jgi:hypothetical protein
VRRKAVSEDSVSFRCCVMVVTVRPMRSDQ